MKQIVMTGPRKSHVVEVPDPKITDDQLLVKIRQFAKRQDSWFRNMERNGIKIYWFKPEDSAGALQLTGSFLTGEKLPEPEFKLSETFYGPRS